MDENEAYEINVVCRNCGHKPTQTHAVRKGTNIKTALMNMACENCGCEGYMGLSNQPG